MLGHTDSSEAMVTFRDLIVSLTVWATHNEIRMSLTEIAHEILCLLGLLIGFETFDMNIILLLLISECLAEWETSL